MCGKFTQMFSWAQVHAFSQPLTGKPGDSIVTSTPMRMASIIHLDEAGRRTVSQMRWGFADLKATNPGRPKHMHARAETIHRLPTFSDSFAHRRGILVVKTFNEGETLPNGKTKQWVISPKDEQPIAIAVIYEEWINGAKEGGDEKLLTFIQVTTPANDLIAPVTDRMPAILNPESLAPDDWKIWLGEIDAPQEQVRALLKTYDDGGAWTIAPQEPAAKKSKPVQDGLF